MIKEHGNSLDKYDIKKIIILLLIIRNQLKLIKLTYIIIYQLSI